MKTLICVTLMALGFVGFQQSADAQVRRTGRPAPAGTGIVYESNRPDRTVQQVQLALRRRGYNPGLITGEFASETRVAIRRYQRDRGLRQSGKIDRALLRSLRIRR
ncbi:hypothetical protein BH20VER1_BH20VER1_01220 [soil metagenome]